MGRLTVSELGTANDTYYWKKGKESIQRVGAKVLSNGTCVRYLAPM
jgi:hypothetical protein